MGSVGGGEGKGRGVGEVRGSGRKVGVWRDKEGRGK